jgi:hypothetical protein
MMLQSNGWQDTIILNNAVNFSTPTNNDSMGSFKTQTSNGIQIT